MARPTALFFVPVIQVLLAAPDEAEHLRLAVRARRELSADSEFARVRVVANLRRQARADGENLELGGGGVDQLGRRFRPPGRAGDDVATAPRVAPVAQPQLPAPLDDEEHLFVDAVGV